MTTATKQRGKSGQVQLSSHDVNVISAIVQQRKALPKNFLLNHARSSNISSDAFEIIEILLDDSFTPVRGSSTGVSKKAAKESIAEQFNRWALATR